MPVLILKKIYFDVIYKDGKGVKAHSVESLMSEHFSQVASIYSQIRTIDLDPINYIAKKLASKSKIVAADIGCGDGRYSIKLIEKLRDRLSLNCVDNNYEMLQQISKISSNFQNLQTKQAPAEKLPFDDNSLDCIFSFNAIHHFEINEFAKECNRVLKNNGLLFIYTRLKEQNESNIWGKFFPDFSKKENRLFDNHILTERISSQTGLNLKSLNLSSITVHQTYERLSRRLRRNTTPLFPYTLFPSLTNLLENSSKTSIKTSATLKTFNGSTKT